MNFYSQHIKILVYAYITEKYMNFEVFSNNIGKWMKIKDDNTRIMRFWVSAWVRLDVDEVISVFVVGQSAASDKKMTGMEGAMGRELGNLVGKIRLSGRPLLFERDKYYWEEINRSTNSHRVIFRLWFPHFNSTDSKNLILQLYLYSFLLMASKKYLHFYISWCRVIWSFIACFFFTFSSYEKVLLLCEKSFSEFSSNLYVLKPLE